MAHSTRSCKCGSRGRCVPGPGRRGWCSARALRGPPAGRRTRVPRGPLTQANCREAKPEGHRVRSGGSFSAPHSMASKTSSWCLRAARWSSLPAFAVKYYFGQAGHEWAGFAVPTAARLLYRPPLAGRVLKSRCRAPDTSGRQGLALAVTLHPGFGRIAATRSNRGTSVARLITTRSEASESDRCFPKSEVGIC